MSRDNLIHPGIPLILLVMLCAFLWAIAGPLTVIAALAGGLIGVAIVCVPPLVLDRWR